MLYLLYLGRQYPGTGLLCPTSFTFVTCVSSLAEEYLNFLGFFYIVSSHSPHYFHKNKNNRMSRNFLGDAEIPFSLKVKFIPFSPVSRINYVQRYP